MRKQKGLYKCLSGLLITAMLAVNISTAMVSMTALADAGNVNLGPGAVQQTAEAAASTLPADSPYKDIPLFIRDDGWVNIGRWNPGDIKGVSFEAGCKIDWDGGGPCTEGVLP